MEMLPMDSVRDLRRISDTLHERSVSIYREKKEALEKAERRRQRRMRGEESESEDEGKGKRKQSKPRGGDDLDDDFVEEGGWNGLGAGL